MHERMEVEWRSSEAEVEHQHYRWRWTGGAPSIGRGSFYTRNPLEWSFQGATLRSPRAINRSWNRIAIRQFRLRRSIQTVNPGVRPNRDFSFSQWALSLITMKQRLERHPVRDAKGRTTSSMNRVALVAGSGSL